MRFASHRSAAALVAAALSSSSSALAQPKGGPQECWEAAERAQELRVASKLTAANDATRICLRETCHPEARRDCVALARDLALLLPTVVVRAKDSRDADVVGVKVVIDGVTVAGSLDGKALPLDPGPHTVRLEAPGGGVVEQRVLTVVKEKDRVLTLRFTERLRSDGTREHDVVVGPPPPPPAPAGTPPLAYVLGGVGIVALGSFVGFELAGQSDYRAARDGCGATKSCTDADVDPGRTKLVVAGVSLAVAAVALAGLFIALNRPTAAATSR